MSLGTGRGLNPEKCAGSSQGETISRTRRPFLPSATKEKALAATLIPSLCLLWLVYALATRGLAPTKKLEMEESRSGLAG